MKNQKYIQGGINHTLILYKHGTKQQILNIKCKRISYIYQSTHNTITEIKFESDEFCSNPLVENWFLNQLNNEFDILCREQEPSNTHVEFFKQKVINYISYNSEPYETSYHTLRFKC